MSKIDLIIDALSRSVPVVWTRTDETERHAQALAYARELQAEKQKPSKEWVGLTTEELSELYNKNYDSYDTDMTFMDFYIVQREVEAKLKEKNT